jgi:hypothetical protein
MKTKIALGILIVSTKLKANQKTGIKK